MSSSCRTLIEAFHDCVMNSPCVKRDGRLPSECLRSELQELPEECQSLRKATYDCKRGMLDMRKRFRGNNVSMPAYTRPSEPLSDTTDATTS